MLNKVINFQYGKARYIVLKELDTRGPIGQILTKNNSRSADIILDLADKIDRMEICLSDSEAGSMPWPFSVNEDHFNFIIHTNRSFANLVLLNSELDWNTFINAWLAFVNHYLDVLQRYADPRRTPDNDNDYEQMHSQVCNIANSLQSVMKLLEIGYGYTELIEASNSLVQEMRGWQQSRPAAIKLSQAYLKSLGFCKED